VYCCGGGVRLWCWYVRRASDLCDVIGISLIEKKLRQMRPVVFCDSKSIVVPRLAEVAQGSSGRLRPQIS